MSKLFGVKDKIWREMELIPAEAMKTLNSGLSSLQEMFGWGEDVDLRNLEFMASASCDGVGTMSEKRDQFYNIARIIVFIGEEAADNVGSDYHGLIVLRSNGILVPTFNLYRSKGL